MTKKQKKVDYIIDILESKQFFQTYSIDSKIESYGRNIILDGQYLQLNIDDADSIVMALKKRNLLLLNFIRVLLTIITHSNFKIQEIWAKFLIMKVSFLMPNMTIRDLSQISYNQKGQYSNLSLILKLIDRLRIRQFGSLNEFLLLLLEEPDL
ncbi:unnamed protein product [Paramecium pentaurelia]|uniref:Uncharacterized protein n=1 Tax=Paramecium pentaurelia TaxID=43138 RepID=A0A8S1XG97_9CILI|nr:unnamed protein product [Paramecium pentaurelia]